MKKQAEQKGFNNKEEHIQELINNDREIEFAFNNNRYSISFRILIVT